MSNMLQTIVPKSDQLNADDLIGASKTIVVTRVSVSVGAGVGDQQPVAINFEGDNGKPYKPCKSMRRVLVQVWGPDASLYAGRSMTLYRDDSVQFGGQAVGGIRISHMSHLDKPVTLALTVTKAKRASFSVRPLTGAPSKPVAESKPQAPDAESFAFEYDQCESKEAFDALESKRAAHWKQWNADAQKLIRAAVDAAKAKFGGAA